MDEREMRVATIYFCQKALEWVKAGEHGDPNGANSYQARKCIEDALALLTAAWG